MTMELVRLDKNIHDRKGFDCGQPELNQFLQTQAAQALRRELSRTMVLVDTENPSKIIGYHTLVYGETSHIPEKSKLYSSSQGRLPVLTLARMAVDKRHQGKRLGEQLLLDSIRRTAIAYDVAAPVIGLFVDAKDDNVRDFYEKYGFEVVNESANGLYLWLPINSCLSIAEELA